jgi:hypothetical protein
VRSFAVLALKLLCADASVFFSRVTIPCADARQSCYVHAAVALLFLASESTSSQLDLLCFPRALASCAVLLLHDCVMCTGNADSSIDTSTDVKLLSGGCITFGVLAQYLAAVHCTAHDLVWLVTSLQQLVEHVGATMPTLLPRPWMMAVADTVHDVSAVNYMLVHGQRVAVQCLSLGMVRAICIANQRALRLTARRLACRVTTS